MSEVQALAEAVPARYRVLILILAFGGLRFGEATALRRRDLGVVERSLRYISGAWLVGPPKSEAGWRTVALPGSVAAALVDHLAQFVPGADDALLGTVSGNFLAGSNFGRTFNRTVTACDLPPVRVHELRHTGASLAAATGASTAELMHRLGHASPSAALIYQHATTNRDTEISRALDELTIGGKRRPDPAVTGA